MANKDSLRLLLPVESRLVGGDPYLASPVTNDDGTPKLIKRGDRAGQPLTQCYTPIAVPKGSETDWKQTAWGQQIVAFARKEWPNGQPERKDFSWKVTDGDDTELNRNNKRPCDRDGYPGHWVLQLQGIQPPSLVNHDGSKGLAMAQDEKLKPGDYVQAYIKVTSNESTQTAGLYLEATHIAFQRAGEAIIVDSIDPSTIGFGGKGGVPAQAQQAAPPQQQQQAAPPPRQEFSAGAGGAAPPPPPVVDRLTAKAKAEYPGTTVEQMLAWNGWTEAALVQHGYLTP